MNSRRFSPNRLLRSRAVGQYFNLPPRNPVMNSENPENPETEETAEDLGSERLPPLRELIWRRHFRRRNVQIPR